MGYQARGLQFDLGEVGDIESLIQNVIRIFGRLDILVNNALTRDGALPLGMLSNEQIESALTANIEMWKFHVKVKCLGLTMVVFPLGNL